ncbi:polysaccharide deacetylase family protein [Cesiribacter andamanensis]|uniref:Bifunctional xylanase/deacetylase n=1 Tax=Cesiribacter andamanensis AMV16 TaxID=1279009 RepID=M7MWW4_9BACT|nr:polysaccharide deacetylase family protein [Cesiribacter andamanensis]EMR00908.1 Bifunctional xylanase/deacetylase precursor [Cesiribacter andamanensis AMV16]
MYLHFTPRWLQQLYPNLLWHMPRSSPEIYLTFDDGPIPEVTPWVLQQLAQWNARATFFCVGQNVQNHPELVQQLVQAGHRLGNHTYHHLKGSQTPLQAYLQDVARCQQALAPYLDQQAPLLFRPPYGRMGRQQRRQLQEQYRIVMWDVLSADYDSRLQPRRCLAKSIAHTRPGSIVVFHDSLKAWDRLQWVLPRYLAHFSRLGYSFAAL